ncbi:MAG TPA: response regulator [Bacteroidales bacterium]|nr:response regulator [Bacteroidales bacterium]
MHDPIVLVVDDDADICYLLQQILDIRNINYVTAHSLQDAKRVLAAIRPTHIFLDMKLPDGCGFEYAQSINQTFPTIKVVITTSYFEDVEARNYVHDKFSIMRKPFNLQDVEEALASGEMVASNCP